MPGIVLGAGDTVDTVTGGYPCFQELKFQTGSSALLSTEHMPGIAPSTVGRAHNWAFLRGAAGEPKAQRGQVTCPKSQSWKRIQTQPVHFQSTRWKPLLLNSLEVGGNQSNTPMPAPGGALRTTATPFVVGCCLNLRGPGRLLEAVTLN